MKSILSMVSVLIALSLSSYAARAARVTVTMMLEPVQVFEPSRGLKISCPAVQATIFDDNVSGVVEVIRPIQLEILALPALGQDMVSAGVRFTLRLGAVSQNLSSGGRCYTKATKNLFLVRRSANGFSCEPGPIENISIPPEGLTVHYRCRLANKAVQARRILPVIQFLLDD